MDSFCLLEIGVFKKYLDVILILLVKEILKVLKRYEIQNMNIFFNNKSNKIWIGKAQIWI